VRLLFHESYVFIFPSPSLFAFIYFPRLRFFASFFAFLRLFMLFRISYAFLRKASCDFFIFISIFVFLLKRRPVSIFHAYLHRSPKKAHRWLFKSYKACRSFLLAVI